MTPEKRNWVRTRYGLHILLRTMLLGLLATAPSGSLSAQLKSSSTEAEVQNRLAIIQNAMKANGIQIHSDDTLRLIGRGRNCVFPPFGPLMPPTTIAIAMSADRNPRTHEFENYPGTYRAMRASNTDLSIDLMINSDLHGTIYSIFPPKAYFTSTRRVIDGGLTPLGGQIYRWDGKELTLTRVDGHPLARKPKDSVGVFHLPITASTIKFGFASSLRGMLLLDPQELRRGNPLEYEPDGVLLHIYPGPSEDGGTIYGPTPLSGVRPVWIRVGESIESPNWRAKVLRIVFPDKEAKLDGWVDLRVEYSTAASERPPAPYLPIAPDGIDDTEDDIEYHGIDSEM